MGPLQINFSPLAQTSSYATGDETWLTNITEIASLNLLAGCALRSKWEFAPLESGTKNSSVANPKICGGQNVSFRANNAILFGILPLKAQNDYIF